jgi:hypothetical protein
MATQNTKSSKIIASVDIDPEARGPLGKLLDAYSTPGKKLELPEDVDRLIAFKFKFTVGTAKELNETIWPGLVRDHLQAIADLVILSKKAQMKPAELRRMKVYQVAVESLRQLFETAMLIRLGEGMDFAFALERGFAELMDRECNIIHDRGPIRCKTRFVKAQIPTGEYPVYERICIRFDGQFDIQLIDRTRYGTGS